MPYAIVDQPQSLLTFLDLMDDLSIAPPSLYIDLDSRCLSGYDTVSIIQIFTLDQQQAYLIDVLSLGSATFTTATADGRTLRAVLEDPAVPKVIFDVRPVCEAFRAHFGINLRGLQDLTIMEVAGRVSGMRYLWDLTRCIESDSDMSAAELQQWRTITERAKRLFDPRLGGCEDIFDHRPVPRDIILYCVQQVSVLPRLWAKYRARLTQSKWREVLRISMLRGGQSPR